MQASRQKESKNSSDFDFKQYEKEISKMANELAERVESNFYKMPWFGYQHYSEKPFQYTDRKQLFERLAEDFSALEVMKYPLTKRYNKRDVYNIPCSFDIETTSFIDDRNKKAAIMYVWQFGINGWVIYGRTWEEFFQFLQDLRDFLELSENRLLYIYVHNLSYEFQFIRKFFDWDKVFALKKRKVLYAQFLPWGIEFRCSYLLANAGLQHVGRKLLTRYPVEKMVGDLDYSLIRHSLTPLTDKELKYCINDVLVVMSFIQEKIEHDGGIDKIPLTNTGYVRNFCRQQCMSDKHASQKYHACMRSLTIDSEEEYDQNKRAFMGGFTHTGILHANKILMNVGSADLTSSYPAEICGSYFPITHARYIGSVADELAFKKYLDTYCCIFDVHFENLMPIVEYESYLSVSRCITENATVNNGRIVSASKCVTTLTELDFDIVNKMYTWDSMTISNLRIYDRGYLPKSLILAVLSLYGNKTKLKGVPEEIVEYMRSKNMVNASFGMMVTDIIRPEISINEEDEWVEEEVFKEKQLNGYNKNFNRFLYYTWGVYVTAHARHNLFEAIMEFADDYVYADTDSIKGINFDKHINFFKAYNFKNKMRMEKMCSTLGIPYSMVAPKTITGEEKLLGDWDIEESYKYFKACGAKRYMYVHEDGKLSLTVAGLNKYAAVPYLLEKYDNDIMAIMDSFEDGFTVPKGYTGKQTLTYIDNDMHGILEDYLGVEAEYYQPSGIHMEAQSFSMSQTEDYIKLLQGVQENELR